MKTLILLVKHFFITPKCLKFEFMNSCQIQIVENLVIKASEKLKVPVSELKGRSLKEEFCVARALIWVVCHRDLSLTFRDIGKYFDRDHKTVFNAYTNMKDDIDVNKERRLIYKELTNG
ncbi:MAG TPA: helix-turn-helix domain-containing protein [Hanamia sp.]|nr:helix-turn-helix domain-containing protein [Hanamia sp.]